MAVTVRYEWVYLGKGGFAENVIKKIISSARTGTLTITPATQVEVPDGHVDGDLYCRMCAAEANCEVSWGDDPTASNSNSLCLYPGIPEMIAVDSDWKLSFKKET